MIIEKAITHDNNIQEKTREKMSKYVDLHIRCQRIWNKKVEMIPIIIGETGVIEKNIKKYLQKMPGQHILGTASIQRKELAIKSD